MRLWATMVSKSLPRTARPCHLSTLKSNLRLWPTFSICPGLEDGPELLEDGPGLVRGLRDGHVIAGVRCEGEGESNQAGFLGIEARRFGIEAERTLPLERPDQFRALGRGGRQAVLMRHVADGLEVCRYRRFGWSGQSFVLGHQDQVWLKRFGLPAGRRGCRRARARQETMAGPEIFAEQAAANGVELEFHEQGLEFVLLGRGHLLRTPAPQGRGRHS